MNNEQLDILRSIGLATLLMAIACGIASMSGCASVQTAGTQQIAALVVLGIIATYAAAIIFYAIANHVRLKFWSVEIDPEDNNDKTPEQKP